MAREARVQGSGFRNQIITIFEEHFQSPDPRILSPWRLAGG
jgi:hypothetical protein